LIFGGAFVLLYLFAGILTGEYATRRAMAARAKRWRAVKIEKFGEKVRPKLVYGTLIVLFSPLCSAIFRGSLFPFQCCAIR
jgi:hypothetical protein